jgi:hypothetical protein
LGERYFSLLEVLDSIYEELSFFGPPGGREDIVDSLKATMEEVRSQIDEGEALPYTETADGKKVYLK